MNLIHFSCHFIRLISMILLDMCVAQLRLLLVFRLLVTRFLALTMTLVLATCDTCDATPALMNAIGCFCSHGVFRGGLIRVGHH